jgi:hypothetical protein
MAKTARTRGLALAKKLGATVIRDHHTEVEVEAPHGYCWSADPGVHSLVSSECESSDTWEILWQDMLERMEYGIEKCGDPDCEWCHSTSEEDLS